MRKGIASMIVAALMIVGCGRADPATGTVSGRFSLPGRPATELQRAGLNFSGGTHGHGHGDTVRIDADGTYIVMLTPGSYSVIGALSGRPPETCAESIRVVVTAHKTSRANFVCHVTAAKSSR